MTHDPQPAADIVGEVYGELRRLAAGYVRRERAQSVQATDLVHEAFLRLQHESRPQWQDRTHFIAIAAIAMRRLLIEHARARGAAKRGGDRVQVTLDDRLLAADPHAGSPDLLELDRALTKLASLDPEQARLVELRYFGGLSIEETADALAISPATVKRHWTMAKAWLLRELQGSDRP
jgi:RNA polymerase sigma factor (TIGR02999 family)